MKNDGFLYNRLLKPGEVEGPVDLCFYTSTGAQTQPSTLVWTPNGDKAATVKINLPAPSVPDGLPDPPTPSPTYNDTGDYMGASPNGTSDGQDHMGPSAAAVSSGG